ncbi:hypothetical protein GCM10023321_57250 [Pseudonocardia eucalypti]|uniref:IstB-like ATP-binding protein domain-containing protein n=1 Tax=Pseudonocardia eucalypti TaxID=648755 RepID=A0ABP9QRU4_9PSEU
MLPVGADAAEAFYRIVDAAYERRSIAVTSNIHPSKAHMFARTCARWHRNVSGSAGCLRGGGAFGRPRGAVGEFLQLVWSERFGCQRSPAGAGSARCHGCGSRQASTWSAR